MDESSKKSKRKTNPILWFVFAILIPLIIAISITAVVLAFAGVDVNGWVKDKGRNIPVISGLIKTDNEKLVERERDNAKKKVEEQEEEIVVLNKDITKLKETIQGLEQELVKVRNSQRNKDTSTGEQAEKEAEEANDSIKALALSFRNMDAEQAAQIIADIDAPTAVMLLKSLPTNTRGEILGAMEPKKAAKLSKQFIEDE